MKRLFFALWPDDVIRQQCVDLIHSLDSGHNRPTEPNNLHVTLLFMGGISDDKTAAVTEAAGRITMPELVIRFDQISFWKKPGILCLTVSKTEQSLLDLVGQLTDIAKTLAIKVDNQTFTPHVTLFRKVDSIGQFDFQGLDWKANSFCLVESCSDMQGVEYKVLHSWPERKLKSIG